MKLQSLQLQRSQYSNSGSNKTSAVLKIPTNRNIEDAIDWNEALESEETENMLK